MSFGHIDCVNSQWPFTLREIEMVANSSPSRKLLPLLWSLYRDGYCKKLLSQPRANITIKKQKNNTEMVGNKTSFQNQFCSFFMAEFLLMLLSTYAIYRSCLSFREESTRVVVLD